jgi:hypothetical protein
MTSFSNWKRRTLTTTVTILGSRTQGKSKQHSTEKSNSQTCSIGLRVDRSSLTDQIGDDSSRTFIHVEVRRSGAVRIWKRPLRRAATERRDHQRRVATGSFDVDVVSIEMISSWRCQGSYRRLRQTASSFQVFFCPFSFVIVTSSSFRFHLHAFQTKTYDDQKSPTLSALELRTPCFKLNRKIWSFCQFH